MTNQEIVIKLKTIMGYVNANDLQDQSIITRVNTQLMEIINYLSDGKGITFPTVLDQLNKLPDNIRDKAILNFNKSSEENNINPTDTFAWTISSALHKAFLWSNTPEGVLYWYDIFISFLEEGEDPYI